MTEAGPAFSGRRGALAAAARWRLPFGRQAWRGLSGNWQGAGAGSSIDFQDHRVYVPGDDPRHIHWQAFARTGALTMKLYRAEVSPMVDLAIDVSASMAFTPAKAARADELLAFGVESACSIGAPVRVHAANGRAVRVVAMESVRADNWRERLGQTKVSGSEIRVSNLGAAQPETRNPKPATNSPMPGPLPWRPGALKVLVSDLLFPGDPAALLGPLAASAGLGVVLVPTLAEEAELPWRGNVELTDCETGVERRQRIDDSLAARYREAYARHFNLWREACRKRGVLMARVPCETPLALALGGEPFSAGVVEPIA
ncbi:MAG TPA: DUF58 domain-containing protein [Opitutaceae bacterium]|nr:DUF58 domain-containing protein [Opitutaceae bacterium]